MAMQSDEVELEEQKKEIVINIRQICRNLPTLIIREAKEPTKATLASVMVYGLVSCRMYVIGMGISIFIGESDIAQIMVKAGLGIAGLLIIVFSTVTTTDRKSVV